MDEVQENEPEKHPFADEPLKVGYAHEESRCGLNSGMYYDENLEKRLGSGDVSSILYYGLNSDSGGLDGGLDLSAFGESKDVLKGENLEKMPSEDGALDLFSSIGLSNASEDYFCDFDFPKKFPDLDYQFPQESESWNSSLVSQSSGSSKNAFGVSESSSQILDCHNNQPERLTACDINGNYMTPIVWDLLRNDETGVNSSYSHDPQNIGEVKNITNPKDTNESYHCGNNGYFGTSFSMQCCDARLLDKGTKAGDPSLQGVLIKKPTYSCDLQEFSEVSPVDTNESYHCSNEGYIGTLRNLNHLWAPLDEITKADAPSSLGVLTNKPDLSCDLDETLELEADHHTLQGVSVNNLLDNDRISNVASPMGTRDSYHGSNVGYIGTAPELDLMRMSFNSMFMEFSDPSLDDEDKEADDPLLQGLLISNPQDIGEPNSVASLVDTGESHDHSSEGNGGNSNNFDFNRQGLYCNSVYIQETDASPVVENNEEDDPTLQSILINKRTKCRKNGPHKKQKRVQKPIQRCNNNLPTLKTKRPRRRKEEPTNSLKRKSVEAKSQNKRHRKRVEDTTLVAHDALTKRSSKQDVDSDDEYDPFQSNMKSRRSKGSDGRKDNKNWTLSEVIKLVDGVSKFGVGKWTAIQKTFSGSPPCRTSLDIRDKWRNLIRTSALRLKHMKEEEFSPKCGSIPLPKSLLEKICELDRAQPYLRSLVKGPRNRGRDFVDSSSE